MRKVTDGGAGSRITEVESLLREHGIATACVEPTGHTGEIAAIVAAPTEWSRIRDLVPRIKDCGFRYVALDLNPDPMSRMAGFSAAENH